MADRPRLRQVNVVARDVAATVEFYRLLGLDAPPTDPPWDRHHRTVDTGDDLDLDVDSSTFATKWDEGWAAGATGYVLMFSVEERATVDALYATLTGAGYEGQQPPWDAFWGARYAIVSDPDGNAVGIMSAVDPDRRYAPPDVD
jgi:catechol 2,3-dioxygenase-like lactoylglutathione lyase family enzyme